MGWVSHREAAASQRRSGIGSLFSRLLRHSVNIAETASRLKSLVISLLIGHPPSALSRKLCNDFWQFDFLRVPHFCLRRSVQKLRTLDNRFEQIVSHHSLLFALRAWFRVNDVSDVVFFFVGKIGQAKPIGHR
jgi:hypothetical protein